MALAALIVSIVAVIVSGVALYRSDLRAGRTEARDRARRHDELQPRLTLTLEEVAGRPQLRLLNDGPLALPHLDVTMVDLPVHRALRFTGLVSYREGQREPTISTSASFYDVGIGESRVMGLQYGSGNDEEDVTVRLRCECRAVGDEWIIPLSIDIPGVPRVHVY